MNLYFPHYIWLVKIDFYERYISIERQKESKFLARGWYHHESLAILSFTQIMLCIVECIPCSSIMDALSMWILGPPVPKIEGKRSWTNELVLETESWTDLTKSWGCQLLGRGKDFAFMILMGYCSINILVCAEDLYICFFIYALWRKRVVNFHSPCNSSSLSIWLKELKLKRGL